MGVVAGHLAFKSQLLQGWQLFRTTGILGIFARAAFLYERGALVSVAMYVLGSVVLAIGGLFVGLAIIRGAVAA